MLTRCKRRVLALFSVFSVCVSLCLLSAVESRADQSLTRSQRRAFLESRFFNEEGRGFSTNMVEEILKDMAQELGYGSDYPLTTKLDFLDLALKASGMAELSDAVDPEDYKKISNKLTLRDIRNLIAARNVDLSDVVRSWTSSGGLSDQEKVDLLFRVLELTGEGGQALGWTTDPDIYNKLQMVWDAASLTDSGELSTLGKLALVQDAATGYSVKADVYEARFVDKYAISYGHTDIRHAKQLVALLRMKGIRARVALEPKTSAYRYLLEWGPVPEPTRTHQVDKVAENFYIMNALEYDVKFEFTNLKDKERFNDLILRYARKTEENPKGKGMLFNSWWQPLYFSKTPMGEGYTEVVENIVRLKEDRGYCIHSITLTKDSENFRNIFLRLRGDLTIDSHPAWCNDAFYRYLLGEGK